MIRSYGWHRFWQWVHEVLGLRAKARFDLHWDRAAEHRQAAEKLRPPRSQDQSREWRPRLWDRDHDPRSDGRRWP